MNPRVRQEWKKRQNAIKIMQAKEKTQHYIKYSNSKEH